MWNFILAVLATWRVTHLLANEDGPADLIVRFRALLGDGLLGKLMDCFYCLSLWVAAPAALFVTRKPLEWLMTWLAISGAACLLERLVENPIAAQAVNPEAAHGVPYSGEGEIENVLRFETHGTEEQPGAADNGGRALLQSHVRQK